MAWTEIAPNRVNAKSPLDETLFGDFVANDQAQRFYLVGLGIPEASTNSTTPQLVATRELYVPAIADYAGIVREIVVRFNSWVTGAGNVSVDIVHPGGTITDTHPAGSPELRAVTVPVAGSGLAVPITFNLYRAGGTGGTTVYFEAATLIGTEIRY